MSVGSYQYLIFGAGPTGIGAAYRLKELGVDDFLILEASDHVGGLATSIKDSEGFVWDIGGHVHFSHYRYYDDALEKVIGPDFFSQLRRNSQIWFDDRFIPYPFQSNIHKLPLKTQVSCLWGLLKEKILPQRSVSNFHEWIYSNFGSGIANAFLIPYNSKVWATHPRELDVEWMSERVARVKFWSVFLNTLFRRNQSSWGPNNMFRFPKKGGTGSIWNAMASFIGIKHFKLSTNVKGVDLINKSVQTDQGTFKYQKLISSIPLDELANMSEGISPESKAAAVSLRYSSTHVIGFGLHGQPPAFIAPIGWMYFPSPDIPFYRATILSNYSPLVVPNPGVQWSLLLEVSESSGHSNSGSELIEKSLQSLRDIGFIKSESEVVSRWQWKAKHGYPIPHLGRNKILAQVQSELESKEVFSRGRFGGWRYEVSNQDHSFMQGVEVISRLIKDEKEMTYPNPSKANRGVS